MIGSSLVLSEPSPSDFDRWEQLVVGDGKDPSVAARELGFRGSSRFRRANAVRHAEVLELWRERRQADDRELARDTLREVARSKVAPESARVSAANSLLKAAGEIPDPEGEVGPVVPTVGGKRVAGIRDVIELAAELGIVVGIGRLAGDAGGDVPAARAVLPAAADGESAAGAVAADD